MTRVVETAVMEVKAYVRVEKLVTKTPSGALRYRQLMKTLGRQVAVPSILINGIPVFEKTPGVDELRQILQVMVGKVERSGKTKD